MIKGDIKMDKWVNSIITDELVTSVGMAEFFLFS